MNALITRRISSIRLPQMEGNVLYCGYNYDLAERRQGKHNWNSLFESKKNRGYYVVLSMQQETEFFRHNNSRDWQQY